MTEEKVRDHDVVDEKHEDPNEAINKEIEAELLAYLESGKDKEEKEEKKKYKSAIFISTLIILILYLTKLSKKMFFIYYGVLDFIL